MNVLEREIGDSEEGEEGAHLRRGEQPEVIVGVDPFSDGGSEGMLQRLEMQERKSVRMLPSRSRDSAETRDPERSTDPDHVVQDSHVAEESGAVKEVELD